MTLQKIDFRFIAIRCLSIYIASFQNSIKFIHSSISNKNLVQSKISINRAALNLRSNWIKAKESKSFYNTRFFYIYHNPCTHTRTPRHFWKNRRRRTKYNRRNRNYRDSATEQCIKATSASAFDEQRKRWRRRGRSRGYGKPRGTPSPEQALSSSRESTRYRRALATLEQKGILRWLPATFEPRRSF